MISILSDIATQLSGKILHLRHKFLIYNYYDLVPISGIMQEFQDDAAFKANTTINV